MPCAVSIACSLPSAGVYDFDLVPHAFYGAKYALVSLASENSDAGGREEPIVHRMRCNDPRKQALAWLIKRNTMAEDEWITRELEMGHRSNVSRAVSAFRSERSRTIRRLKRKLHIGTDWPLMCLML